MQHFKMAPQSHQSESKKYEYFILNPSRERKKKKKSRQKQGQQNANQTSGGEKNANSSE